MKKTLLILAALITMLTVSAKDQISRNANDLPLQARETLNAHFNGKQINRIKIDKKMLGKHEYEVVLADGTEIEFNNEGQWTEIDCGHMAIPAALINGKISEYVSNNYKGKKIVKIEKDHGKFDVELTDGTDLVFGADGQFIKIDH